jgi:hypothetical protein
MRNGAVNKCHKGEISQKKRIGMVFCGRVRVIIATRAKQSSRWLLFCTAYAISMSDL